MLNITVNDKIFQTYPSATIGILELSNLNNDIPQDIFIQEKETIVSHLRDQYSNFTRAEFNQLPVVTAYRTYYKLFKKSYHVQLQLESIILKGKNLPYVNPLVDINFMAEMQTLVLAAGHDVDKLNGPIIFDLSRDDDKITQLNGETREMRPDDIIMRDGSSVSCSIIYGQDNRSPISKKTTRSLYVVYAPDNVPEEAVRNHFELIKMYVKSYSPQYEIEQLKLFTLSSH